MSFATRCSARAAIVSSDPPTSSGFRPNRSEDYPTSGRSSSAATLERPDRDPDPDRVRLEGELGELRRNRQHDAAGGEERERGGREGDEGRRDQAGPGTVGSSHLAMAQARDELVGGCERVEAVVGDVIQEILGGGAVGPGQQAVAQ